LNFFSLGSGCFVTLDVSGVLFVSGIGDPKGFNFSVFKLTDFWSALHSGLFGVGVGFFWLVVWTDLGWVDLDTAGFTFDPAVDLTGCLAGAVWGLLVVVWAGLARFAAEFSLFNNKALSSSLFIVFHHFWSYFKIYFYFKDGKKIRLTAKTKKATCEASWNYVRR
jgi:hypothetical protein